MRNAAAMRREASFSDQRGSATLTGRNRLPSVTVPMAALSIWPACASVAISIARSRVLIVAGPSPRGGRPAAYDQQRKAKPDRSTADLFETRKDSGLNR